MKAKLIWCSVNSYDYDEVYRVAEDLGDWEEVSEEEVRLLRSYLWSFTSLSLEGYYPVLLVYSNEKEITTKVLPSIRDYLKRIQEEKKIKEEKSRLRKEKAAQKSAEKEKELLAKLQAKYGNVDQV